MANWEVIVENIGKVYEGSNGFEAIRTYNEYVGQSRSKYGRASNESVYLFRDGQPFREHYPPGGEE